MNNIDLFVDSYNNFLEAGTLLGLPPVSIKKKENCNHEEGGIEYLLNCFEFPTRRWKILNFDTEYEEVPSNYIPFGTNNDYNFLYILSKRNGEVICWDFEDKKLHWPCGKTLESFLLSMCLLLVRSAESVRTQNWDSTPEQALSLFNKCMELNGGDEKFRDFYEHVCGV